MSKRLGARAFKPLFYIGALLLAVVLVELTLGLMRWVSPSVAALLRQPEASLPHVMVDEELGVRPNPEVPGRDARGFRNPAVPAKAQIVALGDSQTWGMGVEPEEAWPRVLEQRSGLSVYSMAFGGYGPPQSLVLLEEAFALEPDLVIEAFYAGNDLFDAFSFVHLGGRRPELASEDDEILTAIAAAQARGTIEERVQRLFAAQRGRAPGRISAEPAGDEWSLWRRTALYGLWRRVLYEARRMGTPPPPPVDLEALEKAKAQARGSGRTAEKNGVETLLTPDYRLAALDLEDPRIREGLRISFRAIEQMAVAAEAAGTDFLVLLLPTKERVFHDFVREPSPSLDRLIDNEEVLWRQTKELLGREGIDFLDLLPVLRNELAVGRQPYPATRDGHPTDSGHEAIASAVAAALDESTGSSAD